MLKKRIAVVFGITFMISGVLAGCSGSGQATKAKKIEGLDKLGTISVITREEGSGTRGVFAEKINLMNKEKNSSTDKITKDAQIAMNADAVVEKVAADENAIGYVSLGSIKEEEGIKVIAVNEIEPSQKTIKEDSYPLARNFNIAYSGKMSGAENDFLNYILSAGQDVVGQDYTSVKKTSTFLSDQSKGTVTMSGSSSAAPLLEELAADYNASYNKKVSIQIETSDSTSGLTAAMQGSCDWGMASRELKDYEKELLTYKTIAKDGVAVIVNEKNPAQSLTVDQLTKIYDGTDTVWSDVN